MFLIKIYNKKRKKNSKWTKLEQIWWPKIICVELRKRKEKKKKRERREPANKALTKISNPWFIFNN